MLLRYYHTYKLHGHNKSECRSVYLELKKVHVQNYEEDVRGKDETPL